jgi:hypothetical protein
VKLIILPVLASLLTLLLSSAALSAPPPKPNEVHVALGDRGAAFDFSSGLEEMFLFIFTLSYVTYGETSGPPAFTFGYERWLSRWASLGVSTAYASAHRMVYYNNIPDSEEHQNLFTMMIDTRAHWFRRTSFEMYSGLSFGMADWGSEYAGDHSSDLGMAIQVTPIGMRIGRDLAAYGELGIGHNSILRGGLSKRFCTGRSDGAAASLNAERRVGRGKRAEKVPRPPTKTARSHRRERAGSCSGTWCAA